MMTMLARGRLIPVPTVDRARVFLREEQIPLDLLALNRRFITGSPQTVKAQIEEVAAQYGAEEVFLVNILHSHEARRRSYELIAAEFNLQGLNRSLAKRAS